MMRLVICAMIVLLAGCGSPSGSDTAPVANRAGEAASPVSPPAAPASPVAAPSPVADGGSCREEIGTAAADRLAGQCRAASPATHPPCNVANSCATIRAEIERSCTLFEGSDPLPAELCAAAAPSGRGPRTTPVAVIRDYYAAITAHDYARAYRSWRDEGRASGKTLAQFRRGFADTVESHVDVGTPSAPEGAAGSLYVTIPVTVNATTTDGTRQRFTGRYVLRRRNDVPGATAAMREWRIASASLVPVG